jgi:hypothetical protein
VNVARVNVARVNVARVNVARVGVARKFHAQQGVGTGLPGRHDGTRAVWGRHQTPCRGVCDRLPRSDAAAVPTRLQNCAILFCDPVLCGTADRITGGELAWRTVAGALAIVAMR